MSLKKINQFAPFKDIEYNGIFQGSVPRWLEGIQYTIKNDNVFIKIGATELEVVPESRISGILDKMFSDPLTVGGRDKIYERIKEKYIGISRRNIISFQRRLGLFLLRIRVQQQYQNK